MLCFVVVKQSFIMNSHEVFIHIHQGCFAGIVRLPQCQWSKPDGYGKISQCITTTKHSKAKTVCIFLGIYCNSDNDTIHWLRNVTRRALIHIIESILWSLMTCNLFDPKASTAITFTMSNRGPYLRMVRNLSYGPPCKCCDVDNWAMLDLFQWARNNITTYYISIT